MGEALESGFVVPKEYQTELMTTEAFEKYWPHISAELDRVPHIWDRYYTKEYIYTASIGTPGFDVWAVGPKDKIELVVFTKTLVYPAAVVFQVCLAIGNNVIKCLPNLIATLEYYANEAGCDRCEISGRPGWEKLLPGFKRESVTLSRPLQHFKVQ